jgi:hypothetical protein
MKSFNQFLKEEREHIVKSWYHPDTQQEVVVDFKHKNWNSKGMDSHSNHAFEHHTLYGYESPEHIFTSAGHSPEVAKELTDRIRTHHQEEGGYVDWHDPLVHAMHKNGWVRVVKGNKWENDEPNLYVGSHDQELNRKAAADLQNDNETKHVELAAYSPKELSHKDPFSPPSKAKYQEYSI